MCRHINTEVEIAIFEGYIQDSNRVIDHAKYRTSFVASAADCGYNRDYTGKVVCADCGETIRERGQYWQRILDY